VTNPRRKTDICPPTLENWGKTFSGVDRSGADKRARRGCDQQMRSSLLTSHAHHRFQRSTPSDSYGRGQENHSSRSTLACNIPVGDFKTMGGLFKYYFGDDSVTAHASGSFMFYVQRLALPPPLWMVLSINPRLGPHASVVFATLDSVGYPFSVPTTPTPKCTNRFRYRF